MPHPGDTNMNAPTNNIDAARWFRSSVTAKLIWIGVLILLLLIPTAMIRSLIAEREKTSQAAIDEISSKWGNEQVIGGPVLSVPIVETRRDAQGNVVGTSVVCAHFLPKTLNIDGDVKPEARYRGIYEAILYNVPLTLSGVFTTPRLSEQIVSNKDKEVRWDKAFVSIGLSDLRGIRDQVNVEWNSKTLVFNPGLPSQDVFKTGLNVPVPLSASGDDKDIPFAVHLNINGSQVLSFLPLGQTTEVHLKSPWKSPSFVGEFLPEKRDVSSQGFDASWRVLQFNRNYPQQWVGKGHDVTAPNFGVELFRSVDHFQKTTRSAKYAALFIFLTFLVFFLIEIFGRHPLHTIQYLLVGFAMCLFYLLLRSLSEHLPFWAAYVISSLTVVGLVGGYAQGVLRNKRMTGAVFGTVLALYGFLYSLLQMEDYSLLIGTLALTLILGAVMYFTRTLDWHKLDNSADAVQ
jgi:inner membrane protein